MKKILIFLYTLLAFIMTANAQLPRIDKGIQADGLWCFPLQGDSNSYVYLPYAATLSRGADSTPEFSYMRYVMNRPATENNSQSIDVADGGALLNFLVLYNTPVEKIASAERILRSQLGNDSIRLRRPLIFNSGRYNLISSAIATDSTVIKNHLLSSGNAPVMENNKVALSLGLTPVTSKLLLENFKMKTPDVSMVFDLEFSGLTEDYDATLDINWSEVKESKSFNAGVNLYYVAADVKLGLDELMKSQAIKLTVNGSSESMDALLKTVYDKLINLMFQPVEPESLPPQQQQSLLSSLGGLMGGNSALVNVGFQLKKMNMTGKSRLYFKGKSTVQRHHYIVFNIGDLYKHYGSDKSVFRDVPMGDETFMLRKVVIGIDGEMDKEFDNMLNSVTVFINKQHQNGENTNETVLISKENKNSRPTFTYGYINDTLNWLNYRYRVVWQFKGGGADTSDWQNNDAAMINLYVPYKKRKIQLEGNIEKLAQGGFRAVSVQISYPFFSKIKNERITLNTGSAQPAPAFEITQPNNNSEIEYTITWVKKNDEFLQKNGKDKLGIIFIDDIF